MVHKFDPLVDFNISIVSEYKNYYQNIDKIYDLLENEKYKDSDIYTIEKIKYHIVNILFLKRIITDDIVEIRSVVNNPSQHSNFSLQKSIRSLIINIATLEEALTIPTNSTNIKHVNNLTLNLTSPLPNYFSDIRNHVVHEGLLGIHKIKRPTQVAHHDIFTPPQETLGYYIITDNGEKLTFEINQLDYQIFYRFNKFVEDFLDEIIKYCLKIKCQ